MTFFKELIQCHGSLIFHQQKALLCIRELPFLWSIECATAVSQFFAIFDWIIKTGMTKVSPSQSQKIPEIWESHNKQKIAKGAQTIRAELAQLRQSILNVDFKQGYLKQLNKLKDRSFSRRCCCCCCYCNFVKSSCFRLLSTKNSHCLEAWRPRSRPKLNRRVKGLRKFKTGISG